MALWPQFRSPLAWDFFGIFAHLIVVALFWFVGLVPDLATLRDRTRHPLARVMFGLFALGWRGSAEQWRALHRAYVLLAGLVMALLVFMQSIVALEFAATLVPVWHSTLLPPHFVSGALVSGVGAILVLAIPIRRALGLEPFITRGHLDAMAQVLLGASLLVLYAEAFYAFMAWHGGEADSLRVLGNRLFGPFGWVYWAAIGMVGGVAQLLWLPWVRRTPLPLFVVALLVTVGMWLDRFTIVVSPVQQDFLPAAFAPYAPTFAEAALLLGTLGLFATLLVLYVRILPVVSVHDLQKLAAGRSLSP
jgi:Ni/Fe-hydrogenase subunit HybB-like protein